MYQDKRKRRSILAVATAPSWSEVQTCAETGTILILSIDKKYFRYSPDRRGYKIVARATGELMLDSITALVSNDPLEGFSFQCSVADHPEIRIQADVSDVKNPITGQMSPVRLTFLRRPHPQ